MFFIAKRIKKKNNLRIPFSVFFVVRKKIIIIKG